MEIKLRVDIDGKYWSGVAIIEVPEILAESFEPLQTHDLGSMAFACGGFVQGEAAAIKVLRLREGAARLLAGALTKLILSEMSDCDTHNGYGREISKSGAVDKFKSIQEAHSKPVGTGQCAKTAEG